MSDGVKISVIVTFFNAERHIGRCAVSLMRQTMREGIEFVFIDDGSTDDSAAELERALSGFPEREAQIRILSNDGNRGTAFSRERGLQEARGEFVVFCDADDRVEPPMYAEMLAEAERTEADIVCCGFIVEGASGSSIKRFKSPTFPPLNEAPLDTLHFSMCNKIVRRALISGNGLHFFPGIDCWEDLGMMARILAVTDKISIIDKAYYRYRRVAGESITTSRMERVLADHLLMADALSDWFHGKFGNRYDKFLNYLKFTAKIKLMRRGTRDVKRWKATFPETNRNIMGYKNIPFVYRLAFWTAARIL